MIVAFFPIPVDKISKQTKTTYLGKYDPEGILGGQ